jgi:hypothetical protein
VEKKILARLLLVQEDVVGEGSDSCWIGVQKVHWRNGCASSMAFEESISLLAIFASGYSEQQCSGNGAANGIQLRAL